MNEYFFVVLSFLFVGSLCHTCPSIYLRYSKNHSYCLPPNPSCKITNSGMTNIMRNKVLDIHNKYRSYVATGKEKRAGGMPEASDMMQMVWDYELETVIQKYLEQCTFEHDCNACRQVENFSVGQNLYRRPIALLENRSTNANWERAFKLFYEEVQYFKKKSINPYISSQTMRLPKSQNYGHFSQIVWAKTWKVGCGYVMIEEDWGFTELLGCNYGPAGNMQKEPMYKPGEPCSACPINSCCESECETDDYEGLCKMESKESPVYAVPIDYLFYCDFRPSNDDCSASYYGPEWNFVNALGEPFVEILLDGEESSTIVFTNFIKSEKKKAVCVEVKYRSGPNIAGATFDNEVILNFQNGKVKGDKTLPKWMENTMFNSYKFSFDHAHEIKISLTFSVPNGAPTQYLNVQLISVKDGEC